ncbi:MAG: autorepressor SdpR family transcription factor [Hominimerdicola sp.]
MGFPETFKALSDPVRRQILTMLKDGRKSAGEISSQFEMTGATVSYHLSQLKKAGLVYETKEKNFVYYSLNISVFEEIMMWFSQFTDSKEEKENEKDQIW